MRKVLLPLVLAALAAPAWGSPAVSAAEIEGIWLNPHGTVAVRTQACAQMLCGAIVWATPKARSDAQDSGVGQLIGTQVLENYRPHGKGTWIGTVFVPDMGRHFASEIDQISATKMKVKGCILGGLICKSQIWTRLAQVPA